MAASSILVCSEEGGWSDSRSDVRPTRSDWTLASSAKDSDSMSRFSSSAVKAGMDLKSRSSPPLLSRLETAPSALELALLSSFWGPHMYRLAKLNMIMDWNEQSK